MKFEWGSDKYHANFKKHGVCFEKAIEIFLDENRLIILDDRFVYGEERIITIGKIKNRAHVVVYVEKSEETLRIISARKANKREIIRYEQENS